PNRTTTGSNRMSDEAVLGWLGAHHEQLVRDLGDLVAIRSISTDGEHAREIDQSAALTCEQMRKAGLQNVAVLRTARSKPHAYREWWGAPGNPPVFLYAHHDVQPVNDVGEARWEQDDPFKLTRKMAGSTAEAPPTTRAPSPPNWVPSPPISRHTSACPSTSRW